MRDGSIQILMDNLPVCVSSATHCSFRQQKQKTRNSDAHMDTVTVLINLEVGIVLHDSF